MACPRSPGKKPDPDLSPFRAEAAELLGIAEEPAPHQPDEAQTRQ
jgi:hypothetical protein